MSKYHHSLFLFKAELEINIPNTKVYVLQSGRIGAEEEIDDFKGMSEAEVQEILEEREAKANAQILKMVSLLV